MPRKHDFPYPSHGQSKTRGSGRTPKGSAVPQGLAPLDLEYLGLPGNRLRRVDFVAGFKSSSEPLLHELNPDQHT